MVASRGGRWCQRRRRAEGGSARRRPPRRAASFPIGLPVACTRPPPMSSAVPCGRGTGGRSAARLAPLDTRREQNDILFPRLRPSAAALQDAPVVRGAIPLTRARSAYGPRPPPHDPRGYRQCDTRCSYLGTDMHTADLSWVPGPVARPVAACVAPAASAASSALPPSLTDLPDLSTSRPPHLSPCLSFFPSSQSENPRNETTAAAVRSNPAVPVSAVDAALRRSRTSPPLPAP